MRKVARSVVVVAVLGIIAAACGNNSSTPPSGSNGGGTGNIPTGGTLHLASVNDPGASGMDPQQEYYQVSFELMKCCLLRTLFTTNGKPTDEGGAIPLPDLAASDAQQSSDGLTWTFTIQSGIHYSPPLQNVEVTAPDFVRALERESSPDRSANGYPFYYSDIVGFTDYGSGKAKSISGVKVIDDHSFSITTSTPIGDMVWRMALPATAPIPPSLTDPSAPYGIADGHDTDFGRFLVGTGPYMYEGIDQVDFSKPAKQQDPPSGYVPGRQMVLVRNPSWDAATDPNRPAYVDRMEIQIGGDVADLYNKVESGDIDYVIDAPPLGDTLQKYSTDPTLKPYLHTYQQNAVSYISMNLATPPFDDIHVRKALNLIIDKAGGRLIAGGVLNGAIAGHIFPDGLTNNLLQDYNPYATPNDAGDLAKAQAEMALSKYDTNHDGTCDAPECSQILTLGSTTDPAPKTAALYKSDAAKIGLDLDLKLVSGTAIFSKCDDATGHIPLCLQVGWLQDFPDAVTFGPPLFGSVSLYPACCNYSLLGATSDQLKKWGYSVTSVPSVDDAGNKCAAMPIGDARFQCWADYDKNLMENVVPWVPKLFTNENDITSSNVVNYSYDEFGEIAALDHLAVKSATG